MKIRVLVSILLLFAAAIIFFPQLLTPPEPWVPVMEETGFEYLDTSVAAAIEEVQRASERMNTSDMDISARSIDKAKYELLKLKLYYLPVTEMRQLIYDADRLYYIEETASARKKLHEANELLMKVGDSCGPSVKKLTTELILMMDELLIDIGRPSDGIREQFEKLGHQVNLMALKGELILAGAEFDAEP